MRPINEFMSKKIFWAIIILVIIVTLITKMIWSSSVTEPKQNKNITTYATDIVRSCANADYVPFCYEKTVPNLLAELTTNQVFEVIREIRRIDFDYLFCHVLAHEIGTYEVSLDPDNWIDALAKGPADGLCSNGYAHGAILARFNKEYLTPEQLRLIEPELAIACEDRPGFKPTNLHKAICYHGLGHVLIHLTNADIPRALTTCKTITIKLDGRNYLHVCQEGVYMQLFQILEPEDEALIDSLPIKPERENITEFCTVNSRNDTEYGTCWREAWPLFRAELESAPGIVVYCGQLTESQGLDDCFVAAATINGRSNLNNPDKMSTVCDGLPQKHRAECYARGANAFLEEDPLLVPEAVAFCGRPEDTTVSDYCYGFIANLATFNFHPQSPPHLRLCELLPSAWYNTCS